MKYEEIKQIPSIQTYIREADKALLTLGYTEHSFPHVGRVAVRAKYILETLGYSAA